MYRPKSDYKDSLGSWWIVNALVNLTWFFRKYKLQISCKIWIKRFIFTKKKQLRKFGSIYRPRPDYDDDVGSWWIINALVNFT